MHPFIHQKEKLCFLKAFQSLTSKNKEKIVPFLSNPSIHMLCEATSNAIANNTKIKPNFKKTLKKLSKKEKKAFRYLSKSKSSSVREKKNVLSKRGGSLGLILAAVLPVLAQAIISKVIK